MIDLFQQGLPVHRATHLQHFGKMLVHIHLRLLQTCEQLAIHQTQPHLGTDANSCVDSSRLKDLLKLVLQELELHEGPTQLEIRLPLVAVSVVPMLQRLLCKLSLED